MASETFLKKDYLYLTDGGLETTLIFHHGIELPYFAAFDLLKDQQGYNMLKQYYVSYLKIAEAYKYSFILESPTWRANPDWITKLGYDESKFTELNQAAIMLMTELKDEYGHSIKDLIISGCIGPRGDGYKPDNKMSVLEAEKYHSGQIGLFKRFGADIVTALTMNYAEEALGITNAAAGHDIPVVISFTVETDGMLASGMSLAEAIEYIDITADKKPLYYMINCAHPTHFMEELEKGSDDSWMKRIIGIRANASCKSHAELDEADTLDYGDPGELALEKKNLKIRYDHFQVFGGCCGTDTSHILEIARKLRSLN